jgi:hypothetical protein
MCTPSNSSDALAQQQAQQEANTNQAVSGINKAFSGFTPQFFNNVNQSYQGYALPQLQQQYQQTQNQLGFKLADQGIYGKNSVSQGLNNQLQQANTTNTQNIAQQGLANAQQLQQQVGQEQSNLIGQAQTATNPQALSQQAISTAAEFGAPSSFQPIGSLFNNFAQQYLGQQNAGTYNPATSYLYNNPYSLGGSQGFLPSTYQLG